MARSSHLARTAQDLTPSEQPSSSGLASIALSLVSNSRLLCDGLATLLSAHLDLRIVGCYTGAHQAASIGENPPGHVVLLDSGIGREATIAWTRYWRLLPTPTPVIVLELVNDI